MRSWYFYIQTYDLLIDRYSAPSLSKESLFCKQSLIDKNSLFVKYNMFINNCTLNKN